MFRLLINKKVLCIAVASYVMLVFVLPVQAYDWMSYQTPMQWQISGEQSQMHKMTTSGRYGSLQSAKDFLHTEIANNQGEPLGSVREILLDNNRNVVCYIVIESANGILHPVPWSAFVVTPDKITLNIDRSKLMLSPVITISELGRLYSPDYRDTLNDYFSQQIYDAQELNTGAVSEEMMESPGVAENLDLYKCSGAIGLSVRNSAGSDIGSLKNFVFDTREGNIAYGLVAFGGLLGIGEKTAAVPWASLNVQTDKAIVRLDAPRDELEASVIPGNNLEKLNEQQFARQIHENFGAQPYWEVLGFVPPEETAAPMSAWQSDSKLFNPNTITTVKGAIQDVGTFNLEQGVADGLKLTIKTPQNEVIVVHVGPIQYAAQREMNFKPDMRVTVTGSKITIGKETVIIACDIKTGGKTLLLRDRRGEPKWNETETGQLKAQTVFPEVPLPHTY